MNARSGILGAALFVVVSTWMVAAPGSARADATVRVHVVSPVPVRLERHVPERESWELVCAAPCDQDLPLVDEYRVVDEKQRAAETIRLRAAPARAITLTYSPASTAATVRGGALVAGGTVLGAASTAGLILGVLLAASDCGPGYCDLRKGIGEFVAVVSGIGVIGGAALIITGVGALSDSGPHTTQRSTEKANFVREPTWIASGHASTPRPAMFLPLALSF
jgi:hypothetical protein